jgi:hypothetical protein
MKRMKVLFGQRRVMVLVTLTILVLAAAALAASSASFTATSANPGNVFTAGNLRIDNTKDTGDPASPVHHYVLTAPAMAPGDIVTGSVGIKNAGTVYGTFTLQGTATPDNAFAGNLDLTVVQDKGTPAEITLVNAQPLNTALATAIPLAPLAGWAPTEQHTYDFTVEFPNGGEGADNGFMNASTTLALDWKAISVTTP